MKNLYIWLLSCFLLVSVAGLAQEKFSKVKIYGPSDLAAKQDLLGLLEIDHYLHDTDGAIISEVSATALSRLQQTSYRYEVLIDDVAADFENNSRLFFQTAKTKGVNNAMAEVASMGFESPCQTVANIIPTPTLFSTNGLPPGAMGGYYTYAEMVTKIDQLVALYPAIVQKINLGNSLEGRAIWAVKISDNVATDENEPEALFTGLQHAREAIAGTSMIFFMQYLAENYATDIRVKNLVDNREIFIVPCVNPDGYVYNQTTNPGGGGMHRKNRRPNDPSNPGVDLNRNYGIDWANCAGASASCGSASTSSDTYWGTSSFSEPETQAIKNFVTSHHFVIAIDQHCFGPYYSLPFGRPSLHTMNSLDQKFYTYIPALMGKYNCMRAGNSPETVNYEVAGGIKDWLLMGDIGLGTKGKIYGMTGEGGGGNFWAPSSQIISLCTGMCFQNLQLAFAAGSYFDVQDLTDIAVPSLTGNFSCLVRRVGLLDAPVTISIIPLENVMYTGSPVTINSLPNYNDTVTANISYTLYPAMNNGRRIKFVWKIQTGGNTTYDTVTKIYNPLVLFQDDMDAGVVGTIWTVTGGWNYTASSFYNGTRSLTESPGGNYTTNSTRRATYNSTLNLTGATAAYLSFWVKHRAENCRDKLRIQVSTNGGTTWVAVCGKNTVQENNDDGSTLNSLPALTGIRENWTRELMDLSAYNGQPNLSLRFEFTSDNDASAYAYELDDGFYLDNVKVIKTTAVLVNQLPVTFVDVRGKLLQNNTIQVEWEAFTDKQHDYFEVEKSVDGSNFTSIGKVASLPPYNLIDKSPVTGNNYYRIRQTDKDGKFSFSKVINVVDNPTVKLIIYPNPVVDMLRIKIDENRMGNIKVRITDVQGKVVYEQKLSEAGSANEIKVNTNSWKPQVYILKILNSRGEFITIQKFVKQ